MRTFVVVLILVAALAAAYFILTYEGGPGASAPASTEQTAPDAGPATVRLASWNLLNLGGSKSDDEIAFMAEQLRAFDVVAVQEVITSPAGAQAVARLDAALDRTGAAWDYVLSEATTGTGSERYAFLWKPARVRLVGRAWLEPALADPLDREPYLARFEAPNGRRMLVASFHAVPTAKRPADEIALLDALHTRYEADDVLLVGDFNLAESHYAFDELKELGYRPALVDQRTSLRMRRKDGRHLANEYDNIFYEAGPLRAARAGAIDFTGAFRTLREARQISDHLPVYMDVTWN